MLHKQQLLQNILSVIVDVASYSFKTDNVRSIPLTTVLQQRSCDLEQRFIQYIHNCCK